MQALPTASPAQMGVDPQSIIEFISRFEEMNGHAFMLLRHGHVVAQGAFRPFALENLHPIFSVTKSFTAIAVGFAVQEGLLRPDERLVDIFPELLSCPPCDNMRTMQVKHLLNMTSGHLPTDSVIFTAQKDWMQDFMRCYVANPPGGSFIYNNGASNMLSAMVQKRSGQKMADYLRPRFFEPLGMEGGNWVELPGGVSGGGFGPFLPISHLAKLGQFMLQKGQWNGRQLLNAAWVESISSKQVDTSAHPNPTPHYRAGYGGQFWMCAHEGAYRAAGAQGQLVIVLPQEDAVLATFAGHYVDYDLCGMALDSLLPGLKNAPLPEDAAAQEALEQRIAAMQIAPCKGEDTHAIAAHYSGRTYHVTPSRIGVTGFSLTFGEQDVFTMHCRKLTGTAAIGKNGQWAHSSSFLTHDRMYPLLPAFCTDVACTGGWQGDKYCFRMVSTQSLFIDDYEISFNEGGAVMRMRRTPRMDTGIPQRGDRGYNEYLFYGAESE